MSGQQQELGLWERSKRTKSQRNNLILAEVINELNQIADNMENRVIHAVGRGVGVAEAAEVGRDGAVP